MLALAKICANSAQSPESASASQPSQPHTIRLTHILTVRRLNNNLHIASIARELTRTMWMLEIVKGIYKTHRECDGIGIAASWHRIIRVKQATVIFKLGHAKRIYFDIPVIIFKRS